MYAQKEQLRSEGAEAHSLIVVVPHLINGDNELLTPPNTDSITLTYRDRSNPKLA